MENIVTYDIRQDKTNVELSLELKRSRDLISLLKTYEYESSIHTGDDFFNHTVSMLGNAINAFMVFVGYYSKEPEETIETIAVWSETEPIKNFSYLLEGTPCANVVGIKPCVYEKEVWKMFPEDKDLEKLGVNGYVGVPVYGAEQKPMGLIVALFRENISETDYLVDLLSIIAIRVGIEVEKKKILEQSNINYEKYKSVVENAIEGIAVLQDGRIKYANPASLKLLGIGEIDCNFDIFDYIIDEDKEFVADQIETLINSDDLETNIKMRLKKRSGELIWIDVKGVKIQWVEKPAILAFWNDITDSELKSEELINSENKFKTYFNNANDGIYIWLLNDDNSILRMEDVNSTACEMLGYTKDELIKLLPQDLNSKKSLEQSRIFIRRLSEEGKANAKLILLHKDGSEIPVEINSHLIKYNNDKLIISIVRDIKERVKALENLEKTKYQLKTIVDNSEIVFFAFDKNGIFTMSEGKGLNKLGLKPGQVLGLSVYDVYKDYPNILEMVKNGLSGESFRNIYEVDGIIFDIIIYPIKDKENENNGVLGLAFDITSFRNIQSKLEESEEQYRLIFMNNPNPMWVYEIETLSFLEVNESAIIKYGYSRDEFLKMTIKEIRPPEEIPKLLRNIGKPIKHTEKKDIWKHLKKDSSLIFVEITSHLINFKGKSAEVVIVNDITEKILAEKALKESEEAFRLTAKLTGELVYDFDLKTGNISWFGAIEEITGYDEIEFQGFDIISWSSNIHPDDNERVQDILDDCLENGTRFFTEYRFKHKSGQYFYVEDYGIFLFNAEGLPNRMLGTMKNINERINQQQRLTESEEKYRTLTSHLPVGVYRTTIDGRFLFANITLAKILGYKTVDELMEINAGVFYTDVYDRLEEIDSFRITNVKSKDIKMITNGGKQIWVRDTSRAIKNDKEEIIFFDGILEDITEFRKTQDEIIKLNLELEQKVNLRTSELNETLIKLEETNYELRLLNQQIAEESLKLQSVNNKLSESEIKLIDANKLKDRIISIIAHDVKNLLQALFLNSEIMISRAKVQDYSDFESRTVTINRMVKTINGLLDNLLTWSRSLRGTIDFKPVKIKIIQTIENCLNILKDNIDMKKININHNSLEPEHLLADRDMIETVFRNLISNAIKFTPEFGSININWVIDENNIIINFEDTGIGIPAEFIDKLFTLDTNFIREGTFREKGTGLGLLICKEFIEKHNGKIWVDELYNNGTCFKISLPLI